MELSELGKLSVEEKLKFIESLEDDQLKINYINNLDDFSIELSQSVRLDIIKSLKSDRLKIDCLIKFDLELSPSQKVEIIEALTDEQLKIGCITNSDINLELFYKVRIVGSLSEDQLKINYITNPNIKFEPYHKARIIRTLTDDEVKLNFLKPGGIFGDNDSLLSEKTIIIASLKSDQLKMDYLTSFDAKLSSNEEIELITSLKSDQLKIDCLTNSEFKLHSYTKSVIIERLSDEKLKINCLTDPNIELEPPHKARIISTLPDDEVKLKFIKISESFGDKEISLSDKTMIIATLDSDQLKIDCLTNSALKLTPKNNSAIIESLLDEQLKIDCLANPNIELESFNKAWLISTLTDDKVKFNFLKTDKSFSGGDASSKDKAIIIESLLDSQLKIDCLISSEIELNSNDKAEIIKSLLDSQLKIDCLTSSEIELSSNDKTKIIKSLSEDRLMVDCLTDPNIKLEPYDNRIIIRSLKDEQLKIDCLTNLNVELEPSDKAWLISVLTDEEIKLNFLKTDKVFEDKSVSSREKLRIITSFKSDQLKIDSLTNLEVGLDSYDKCEIIKSLSDDQLKMDCLSSSDIKLDPHHNGRIIGSMKEEQLRINCLTNPNIELELYDKVNLIVGITDDEVKLSFLKIDKYFGDKYVLSSSKKTIINSLDSNQLKVDCLINLDIELYSDDKYEIIERLSEEQLKVDCLSSPDIKLESSYNEKIIRSLKDEQLKIYCLANPNIELEQSDKVRLISTLTDDEVKLNYVEDPNISFREQDKLIIIWSLQDEKKLEKFGVFLDKSYKKGLDLPSNMTIGVELEAEGGNTEDFNFIGDILNGWKAKRDGSLQDGVEIVSPILYSSEEDMYSIAKVCHIMQRLGLNTSERCGGHIHFGADFLGSDPKTWEKFYTIYNECEEIFYKMSNETGRVPRIGVLQYAATTNDVFAKMFATGEVSMKNQEEFDQVMEELKTKRRRGVNVRNVGNDKKNTIEFRMPNGTLNSKAVIENIKLFGSLLKVSKEMALDPEYKREEFETIKHKDLTEKEKTEALLNILFDDEEEKSIYRERWDAVKDNRIFEILSATNPTFIRGDYSMKEQSKDFFEEVSPQDREEFLQDVRREIDNSRDITEEQERL